MDKSIKLDILLPDWVSWVAQDSVGTWFGYDVRPDREDGYWSIPIGGSNIIFLANGFPPEDFTQELYEIS